MDTVHLSSCPVCLSVNLSKTLSCKDFLVTQEVFVLCSCTDCGFSFTQDFPQEKSIGKYYDASEYISHTDTKKGIINKLYHYARKIALRSKIKLVTSFTTTTDKSLLDVGCGTGYFIETALSRKWSVAGIEKSESVRKQVSDQLNIEIQDADYLPHFKDSSKDAITMWHVLEHVENLNETMDQLYRILKNTGTAFIALPNKKSVDALYYKAYWAAYDIPRHLWHFSVSDFTKLANKHNFEVIEKRPMLFDPIYISMLSEKYKNTPLATLVGLVKGMYFCFKSLLNKEKCSSIIYILKKK